MQSVNLIRQNDNKQLIMAIVIHRMCGASTFNGLPVPMEIKLAPRTSHTFYSRYDNLINILNSYSISLKPDKNKNNKTQRACRS